jgi:hypothetical protein
MINARISNGLLANKAPEVLTVETDDIKSDPRLLQFRTSKSNPFYYFSKAELQRGSLKVSLDKNSFSWLHGVGDKKILKQRRELETVKEKRHHNDSMVTL